MNTQAVKQPFPKSEIRQLSQLSKLQAVTFSSSHKLPSLSSHSLAKAFASCLIYKTAQTGTLHSLPTTITVHATLCLESVQCTEGKPDASDPLPSSLNSVHYFMIILDPWF